MDSILKVETCIQYAVANITLNFHQYAIMHTNVKYETRCCYFSLKGDLILSPSHAYTSFILLSSSSSSPNTRQEKKKDGGRRERYL